jgi:LPXTG-motif cell wall-anchored protein
MEEVPMVKPSRQEPLLAKPAEPPPVFENKTPEPAPSFEPAPVTPPPPAVQAPSAEEPEAAADDNGNVAEQPAAAMNWDQLVEQNSIAILIGAALIILLLALAARKKRLKAKASSSSSGDAGESTEDTPSKFRRK